MYEILTHNMLRVCLFVRHNIKQMHLDEREKKMSSNIIINRNSRLYSLKSIETTWNNNRQCCDGILGPLKIYC